MAAMGAGLLGAALADAAAAGRGKQVDTPATLRLKRLEESLHKADELAASMVRVHVKRAPLGLCVQLSACVLLTVAAFATRSACWTRLTAAWPTCTSRSLRSTPSPNASPPPATVRLHGRTCLCVFCVCVYVCKRPRISVCVH
jgi:hypothetical protein